MHQVYSNAAVNIAADDARDGTEGLFRDRDSRLCEPLEVGVEWMKEHRGTYFAVDNFTLAELQRNNCARQLSMGLAGAVAFSSHPSLWENAVILGMSDWQGL
jgi:hypothetical protein